MRLAELTFRAEEEVERKGLGWMELKIGGLVKKHVRKSVRKGVWQVRTAHHSNLKCHPWLEMLKLRELS